MSIPYELRHQTPQEHDETYPALKFQRHFGLRDIGCEWTMPDGKTMYETEQALWYNEILALNFPIETILTPELAAQRSDIADTFDRAHKIADTLRALNPALRDIDVDPANWGELRGFIHGVVSGFNTDDIQYWIKGGRRGADLDGLRDRIYNESRKKPEESWYPQSLTDKFNGFAHAMGVDRIAFIYWVPCPKTIGRIHAQLDEKQQKPQSPSPSDPTLT